MATIKTGTVQYYDETSYGVRYANTTIAYRRFGLETGDMPLPKEKPAVLAQNVVSKFVPNKLGQGEIDIEWDLQYVLVDAKELSYIGVEQTPLESTTPDKRHYTIPLLPSDGFAPPSRTVHIELSDGTTVTERLDVAGTQTKAVEVTYTKEDPRGCMVKETFKGQRITTDAATTNLLGVAVGAVADPETVQGQYATNRLDEANVGSKPPTITGTVTSAFRDAQYYDEEQEGFELTSFVIGGDAETAITAPTTFGDNTGGTDLTSYLKTWQIKIEQTMKAEYPNRSGYNNYGASIWRYPYGRFVTATSIMLTAAFEPNTNVLGLLEDVSKNTTSSELYVKVSKPSNSDDWIAFVFKPLDATGDATENIQTDYEGIFGFKVIDGLYTVTWVCKDIIIVAGNEFDTLRSLLGT